MEADLNKQGAFFQKVTLPLARVFCWTIMTLFGPYKRRGQYRVPKSGGVLVLSNHLADIDPIIVQLACTRPIYFMAKSELFEMRVVGSILRMFKAFPVKRGEPDRSAIKQAVNLLKSGEVVCVYPEGELSETGDLLPLKPGIALIVRMSQVPVICLGIVGSNWIMPYGKVLPRPAFRTLTATWGEPHTFSKEDTTETIIAWATGQLNSLTLSE
jgi:1-acyl-sn-glycerol-3-phosphate acyltransferase